MIGAGVGPALANAERSPIQPEGLLGPRHPQPVIGLQNVFGGGVGDELDEAVAFRVSGDLVADDLDRSNLFRVCREKLETLRVLVG